MHMQLQPLQPVPCFDPAQDLQGNEGSFIWVDGGKIRLIVAKHGHSIVSIREITEVPGFLTGLVGGTKAGTLTKISNQDLSQEYENYYAGSAGKRAQDR